jgi:hypothetical protein
VQTDWQALALLIMGLSQWFEVMMEECSVDIDHCLEYVMSTAFRMMAYSLSSDKE